ncbi:hypothetical protein M422DRAFT_72322 [Sphaerobolus stellatus SS14]|uniref:Uncharacterized protein n=1 Tax=Sphaerobolus stellatus (strain SS14) TaxID=990650 RepID=A0A0C9UHN0_SPHS4|nr:hypothetical protein M422DRAFT_72322 [Sphaerobolus stellatus SS14]
MANPLTTPTNLNILKKRFEYISGASPHYEASWYGPINKLANAVFCDAQFMVKPQPRIRGERPPNSQSSLDSYNIQVGVDGTHDKIPDFIIVKMRDDAGHPKDIPLLVIEVKKDDANLSAAKGQLRFYLNEMQKKGDADCRGILVVGSVMWNFLPTGRRAPHPQGLPHQIWPTLLAELEKSHTYGLTLQL